MSKCEKCGHEPESVPKMDVPSGASIDKVKRAYVECVKAIEMMPADQGAFVHVSAAAAALYDAYDEWFHAAPDDAPEEHHP